MFCPNDGKKLEIVRKDDWEAWFECSCGRKYVQYYGNGSDLALIPVSEFPSQVEQVKPQKKVVTPELTDQIINDLIKEYKAKGKIDISQFKYFKYLIIQFTYSYKHKREIWSVAFHFFEDPPLQGLFQYRMVFTKQEWEGEKKDDDTKDADTPR